MACVLGKKPINDSDPLLFPLLNQEIFLQLTVFLLFRTQHNLLMMSSSNTQSPSTFNSDSLQSFLKQVTILATSPESQAASVMFEEINHQRQQMHARDEELKKA